MMPASPAAFQHGRLPHYKAMSPHSRGHDLANPIAPPYITAKGMVFAMGSVNWLGVLVAALAALVLERLWYGPLFGRIKTAVTGPRSLARGIPVAQITVTFVLLLISSIMLGHLFARTGSATLEQKPWLYFMMSGGLAVTYIVPALWITLGHQRTLIEATITHAAFWICAYLVMGTTFWFMA